MWDIIADDFLFAFNNLPQTPDQAGRANRNAAAAYLAKLRLYQAYEQDDQHQVININEEKLQEVINYANEVTGSLEPDFANNFLPGYENGSSLFGQFSFHLTMELILEEEVTLQV